MRRIVTAFIRTCLCASALSGLPLSAQSTAPPPAAVPGTKAALIVTPMDRPPVQGQLAKCGWIRFLVNSEETGGAFSVVESNECGRELTVLHQHADMDESFYVAEGHLTIYANGRTHTLGPGSYFFVPRGVPHAQGNPCPVPNRVLVTFSPGGFERRLRDRIEVLQTTTFGTPEFHAAMKARGHGGGGGDGGTDPGLGKPAPVGTITCP